MRRVLVIDDDDLSREVLELLLGDAGYEVNLAASGKEALANFAENERVPDVVLMDWQMPGISGNELARRLREVCGQSTLLLAMSGSKVLEERATDGFLQKPFSMEELEAALQVARSPAAKEPMFERPDRAMVSEQASEHPNHERSSIAISDAEVLDPQTFRGLETMVSKAPLADLYRQCVRDAERHVLMMRDASISGDDAALRKHAHAIKGSLGMVGARELQQLCAALEESGIAGNHAATLAEFPDAIERLKRMLIARGVEI